MRAHTEHCNYCGSLGWTVTSYGRATHKESCPHRLDDWHQAAPHDQLREAVAKALWEAQPEGALPRISWEEAKHPQVKSAGPVYGLADAAIRVCLAAAQRRVAALPHYTSADGVGGGTSLCFDVDDVMAALTDLAEGAA